MIQLTLNFNTVEEAQTALAKLSNSIKPCSCDQPAPAPAAPAPAPNMAPAPPATPAPAPPAPAPPAPAPAASAPPATPALAASTTLTLDVLNQAAVAKAGTMQDKGAAILNLMSLYDIKGLAELPVARYDEFYAQLQALGGK